MHNRVLLLPPTSRDADAIQVLLAQHGIVCKVCPSVQALCHDLDLGAGAVVVSEESITADDDSLVHHIAAQPVWSDLPIVVLSRSGVEGPRLAAALSRLGNVSVLERPVRTSTLVSVVRSAVRARQRQYQVRDYLAERERTAAELKHNREQMELVVKGASIGVWMCPLPFDRLIWDETVRAHFHLPLDTDVTIDIFYKRLHPEDRERVRNAIETSVSAHEPYDIEYRTVSPDGQHIKWIRASGRGFYDADGNATRFDGITLDVTDRKTAEERRSALLQAEQSARSEAERAGRMKDEFLATLSHELRTPLNAILGWAQLLKMGTPSVKDITEGVSVIERNARAQAQIIEDLLDMNRIISGKIRLETQRLDLALTVRAAMETVQPAAYARDIRLHADFDPELASMSGDPNRLQQVFWNLLSNAVKFTPKGGNVFTLLRRVNSQFEVRIIDTGEGIDPEFLPHVFDRFRQADASTNRHHGGLGLGLAIVKQLVELHGGSISAASSGIGNGSTFTVSLPITAVLAHIDTSTGLARPSIPVGPRIDVAEPTIRGLKIVIIDDEPDARGVLRRLLEERQANVHVATSVGEAIALIESERPDVLISDIGMPGEDGYALIRRVRALPPDRGGNTPAVALTAYARVEDRANSARAGFQRHLAKPITPAELFATVSSLATAEAEN